MRYFLLVLLLTGDPGGFHKITIANKAKDTAEKEYKAGKYNESLKTYRYLTDSLEVNEDEVVLNKAHCYFKLKNDSLAMEAYAKLVPSSNKHISSIASQQLGMIASQMKDLDKALSYFKSSLKADPANADARFDYELVKKQLDEQKEHDKDKKNDKKDQEEPSLFAKRLKARAEALAAAFKFDEAHHLMAEGLKRDKTVSHFRDFIGRLKDVSDISKL